MSLQRFAAYGTLGPGKPNHHHMEDIDGSWSRGRVRGNLAEVGWGAALGFPGITLSESDNWVEVDLLESETLEAHWARLDEFEGPGYRRVVCTVVTDSGPVEALIYEIVPE